MTQELVLGVLLAGLGGLVWILAISIWTGDDRSAERENSADADGPVPGEASLQPIQQKRRSVIAA